MTGSPQSRYSLFLPSDWTSVDVPSLADNASFAMQAALASERGGVDLSDVAPEVQELFQVLADGIARSGIVECYVFAREIEGCLAVASLSVAVVPEIDDAVRGDLGMLALRAKALDADGSPHPRDVSIINTLAGEAVRTVQRRSISLDVDNAMEHQEAQFMLPLPGENGLLVLAFSTPNVGAAEAFVDLFDTIAAGLRWI